MNKIFSINRQSGSEGRSARRDGELVQKEENLARLIEKKSMDLLHTVEQSPIGQNQEEMDAHDENNSNKNDIPFHYSNAQTCLLFEPCPNFISRRIHLPLSGGWNLPQNYF